jgi:hypothetical protein
MIFRSTGLLMYDCADAGASQLPFKRDVPGHRFGPARQQSPPAGEQASMAGAFFPA